MKTRNKIKLTIIGVIGLVSIQSWASGVGNGGAGISVDGKLYLLDLVEGAVEKHPYFDQTITVNAELKQQILNFFPQISAKTADLFGKKLIEIENLNRPMGIILRNKLKHMNFMFPDKALANPYFEHSIIRCNDQDLVRLAVRDGSFINLNTKEYAKLDFSNQAALLVHEILSSSLAEDGNTDVTRGTLKLLFNTPAISGKFYCEPLSKNDIGQLLCSLNQQYANGSVRMTEETDQLVAKSFPSELRATYTWGSKVEITYIDYIAHSLPAIAERICSLPDSVTSGEESISFSYVIADGISETVIPFATGAIPAVYTPSPSSSDVYPGTPYCFQKAMAYLKSL